MMQVIKAYGQSSAFLRKHGLSWFLWFPLAITALVIVGGFMVAGSVTDTLFTLLMEWIDPMAWLPDWAGFFVDIAYWLLWIGLHVLLYFILAFVGGSIILLLMSPILTWLSEKVAESMGRATPEFSITQLTRDITRAAGLAIRNGLLQLGLSILCLAIGLIPVIGIAAPFLLFFINAYFYGYGFLDYTLERRRYSVAESSRFAWRHRYRTAGIGAPFALWMLIPFIGPMTAGFVAIYATVAGTVMLEAGVNAPVKPAP